MEKITEGASCLQQPAAVQFWKKQATEYPIMSQTARRLLCITASSAQSERDFSSVGRTVTDKRSRLNEDTVEAIELLRWGCVLD